MIYKGIKVDSTAWFSKKNSRPKVISGYFRTAARLPQTKTTIATIQGSVVQGTHNEVDSGTEWIKDRRSTDGQRIRDRYLKMTRASVISRSPNEKGRLRYNSDM